MNNEPNIQHSGPGGPEARILAAARARFRRFGYAKTSMHDMAAACRMSAANLYRFYENKLAIATAVAAVEQRELLAACDDAVLAAAPESAGQLIALFAAIIDATRRRIKHAPLLFELDLKVARENGATRRKFLNDIESRIVAILGRSVHGPVPDADTLKVRAHMILIACAPFVLPWMLLNEPFGDPRAHVEPLVRALVAGLSGNRPERIAVGQVKFG